MQSSGDNQKKQEIQANVNRRADVGEKITRLKDAIIEKKRNASLHSKTWVNKG